jgi:SAM-dependent methyltransferase
MKNICPLCKISDYKRIGYPDVGEKSQKIIKINYSVVQCNNCRFYFIDPPINFLQEEWEYLYNDDYFSKSTNWHLKQREKDRKERFNKLQNYSSAEIKNFLDIGCGEGYTLLEAFNRGWDSYGLDIHDHRTEEIKKINSRFIKGDLFKASFPDNYFDVVYLDSVLEHVNNPLEYLTEINRILKNRGLIYIGVPNEDSMLNDFRKLIFLLLGKNDLSEKLMPFKSPYHIGGFNSFSLDFIVEKTKFSIKNKRNFACRTEFLKYSFLSREFLTALLFYPIYLLAVPFRKEVYFELYLEKYGS